MLSCWSEPAALRQGKTPGVRVPSLHGHAVLDKQEPEAGHLMSLGFSFLACEELWPVWSLMALLVIVIRKIASVYSFS